MSQVQLKGSRILLNKGKVAVDSGCCPNCKCDWYFQNCTLYWNCPNTQLIELWKFAGTPPIGQFVGAVYSSTSDTGYFRPQIGELYQLRVRDNLGQTYIAFEFGMGPGDYPECETNCTDPCGNTFTVNYLGCYPCGCWRGQSLGIEGTISGVSNSITYVSPQDPLSVTEFIGWGAVNGFYAHVPNNPLGGCLGRTWNVGVGIVNFYYNGVLTGSGSYSLQVSIGGIGTGGVSAVGNYLSGSVIIGFPTVQIVGSVQPDCINTPPSNADCGSRSCGPPTNAGVSGFYPVLFQGSHTVTQFVENPIPVC